MRERDQGSLTVVAGRGGNPFVCVQIMWIGPVRGRKEGKNHYMAKKKEESPYS